MTRFLSALLLTGLLVAGAAAPQPAPAGEFNEVLSVGDTAPKWENLPGTDGKQHSLTDLADKPVVVVVFTCASCPFAVAYEQRIGELIAQRGGPEGKVAVVPICVNNVTGDDLEALKKRVETKSLPFHYLHDKSQKIAKDFGANFTPEFYVLDKDRKVVYMGAMDDNADATKVKTKYLDAAITAALEGKTPEKKEAIAHGCRIRYARERRS